MSPTEVTLPSATSVQINETSSRDIVLGWSYKWQNFRLFGGRNHRAIKSTKKGDGQNGGNDQSRGNAGSSSGGTSARNKLNHDLNLRCDISFRQQASISRDIASMTSSASSGNSAFKMSFTADYTLSRLITMSFYFNRQTNTPLLSSNSYPTTTQDFGLSLKFSLRR